MTCIAWDCKTLVADGRCTTTDGKLVADNCVKLHKINITKFGGECVVGLAGALDCLGPFLDHLESNGPIPMEYFRGEDADEEYFMRGLAVNRKGQCFEFSTDGCWSEVDTPNSIGTGQIIAQHYLYKGCTALEAVLESCVTELTCGGVLLSYDWNTGKFTEHRP
jgi:hypothetical protein